MINDSIGEFAWTVVEETQLSLLRIDIFPAMIRTESQDGRQ